MIMIIGKFIYYTPAMIDVLNTAVMRLIKGMELTDKTTTPTT